MMVRIYISYREVLLNNRHRDRINEYARALCKFHKRISGVVALRACASSCVCVCDKRALYCRARTLCARVYITIYTTLYVCIYYVGLFAFTCPSMSRACRIYSLLNWFCNGLRLAPGRSARSLRRLCVCVCVWRAHRREDTRWHMGLHLTLSLVCAFEITITLWTCFILVLFYFIFLCTGKK